MAAALFVLSRIRRTQGHVGSLDLTEMEKALDILVDLSDPEDRQRISVVRDRLVSLEKQKRDFLREHNSHLMEQNSILGEEVSALLLRQVPEDQRDEIEGRLEEIMVGDDESPGDALELPERQMGESRLERKLRMLDDDSKAAGLERFLDADEGEVGD